MSDRKIVSVMRRFEAAPERVFDAWLDPAMARKFLFATPTGEIIRAEIDPVVGGKMLVVDRRDGVDVHHYGQFLEIDRPRRLVFSFSVEDYGVNAETVTIEVRPDGAGSELTLTHATSAEYAERTQAGWTMIVESLARALA